MKEKKVIEVLLMPLMALFVVGEILVRLEIQFENTEPIHWQVNVTI